MTTRILFSSSDANWEVFGPHLRTAFDNALGDYDLSRDHAPETVEHIVYAPDGPVQDFGAFPRLRGVHSLWAGVEGIVGNPTLKAPLARMVDDEGLTQGMVEWVSGHALRHHLGMDAHIVNPDHRWNPVAPPLAADRPVTVLGLGALGLACARALRTLGFPVTGWSRRPKQVAGITCRHGEDGLDRALSGAAMVVLLLPRTPETENVLNARTLGLLAPGAFVLNPGRGPLIDDDALIAALDSGQVAHATLDVFRTEPLPEGHPFWAHPRVTVTPHIASETRAASGARVIADNIRRDVAGKPMQHLVDREAGY